MKEKILKLKSQKSLYEVALDIGVSEASLYCYLSNYKKTGKKVLERLENYFKGNVGSEKFCK